jgi:hypothetical protein
MIHFGRGRLLSLSAWALFEEGDLEAIDVFLRREDAEEALADCLHNEPQWQGLLYIEEIELAGAPPTPN